MCMTLIVTLPDFNDMGSMPSYMEHSNQDKYADPHDVRCNRWNGSSRKQSRGSSSVWTAAVLCWTVIFSSDARAA